MSTVLVKFDRDWGDEFDVENFEVVENTTVEELKATIKEALNFEEEYYFGSNEGWGFSELSLEDFSFRVLEEAEYELLKNLFGVRYNGQVEFGTGSGIFTHLREYLEEIEGEPDETCCKECTCKQM